VEVLKKLVEEITKPSLAMHKIIFGACSDQVARMKAAQVYTPIFCVINDVTSGDMGELALVYRFFSAAE
jgi:hypothetical protein